MEISTNRERWLDVRDQPCASGRIRILISIYSVLNELSEYIYFYIKKQYV